MKFKNIGERIDFYKQYSKYGIEPWRLRSDNEELYHESQSYDYKNNWTNGSCRVHDTYYFLKWLFEYCFGDLN
jgi:hypothetical protein